MFPAHLLSLLQLSDSMFPTGAFAHSQGLETYVQSGLVTDRASLCDWLTVQLRHNLATADMVICKEAFLAYNRGDGETVLALDQLLTAAKPAAELRKASEEIGRRTLKSGMILASDNLLESYQAAISAGRCAGHHAVVWGLLGGALTLDLSALLLAYAYTFVASQTSAAVRLIPLGQTHAQQSIAALGPVMQEAVDTALATSLDDFATFVPALEIRAMQHHYLNGRLFIS